MRSTSAEPSPSPFHVPLHTVTLSLTGVICVCSVMYGLMTHENIELMGIRRDLTPLYLSLGPSWLSAPFKLLFSQFVCLSPGELVMTVACVSCSGKLDRLISLQRLCCMFALLLFVRLATVVTWCAIVAQVSLVEARVRPSALWMCVSVYVLRTCLCRSQGQLLLGRVLPVNAYPMHHVMTFMLVASQSGSFFDTTIPSAVAAGLLCSEVAGIHRWAWADASINAALGRFSGGRRVTHYIKKSISFPSNAPNTAARNHSVPPARTAPSPIAPVTELPQPFGRRATTAAAPAQQQPVSETSTQELVAMGFSEVDSRAALTAAHGDLNLAAVWLLEGRQVA
jgi:hypothetical protein